MVIDVPSCATCPLIIEEETTILFLVVESQFNECDDALERERCR